MNKDDSKRKGMKRVKCMNHDPANSKWGEYAPEDGPCLEMIDIDLRSDRGLCWRCTSRSVSMIKMPRSE
jgi:hypothetical protein